MAEIQIQTDSLTVKMIVMTPMGLPQKTSLDARTMTAMDGQILGICSLMSPASMQILTMMAMETTPTGSMAINAQLNGVIPLRIVLVAQTATMTVGLTQTIGANGVLFGLLQMGAMHSGKMRLNGPITIPMAMVITGLIPNGTILTKRWV